MRWRDALPDWLTAYQRSWLPSDLAAGAATWAVLVPLSLSIAGGSVTGQNGVALNTSFSSRVV